MAVLFSSLSALAMGAVRAAKAVVTEIIPPAATLLGDIVAAAWASVAWSITFLWASLAAAFAVAVNLLPYAAVAPAAVARIAAWSMAQASRLFLGVALNLTSYAWSLSSAAVAGAVRAAKGVAMAALPAAVASVHSVVSVAWATAAWLLCRLGGMLSAAAAVAVDALPRAAAAAMDAAGSAARASQPWLDLAMMSMHGLYGWLVTVAVEVLPDPGGAARAAKDAARSVAEASKPWLEMASRRSGELYGWLVAAAAEKHPSDAAACARAIATDEKLSSAAAAAVVVRMESTAAAGVHEWPWFVHGHGVAVYVMLALALLAVAFVCGGVCALALRSHLPDHERHRARQRPHPPPRYY